MSNTDVLIFKFTEIMKVKYKIRLLQAIQNSCWVNFMTQDQESGGKTLWLIHNVNET